MMKYGDKVTILTEQRAKVGLAALSIVEGKTMYDASTIWAPTEVTVLGLDDKNITFQLDDDQVWTTSLEEFESLRIKE